MNVPTDTLPADVQAPTPFVGRFDSQLRASREHITDARNRVQVARTLADHLTTCLQAGGTDDEAHTLAQAHKICANAELRVIGGIDLDTRQLATTQDIASLANEIRRQADWDNTCADRNEAELAERSKPPVAVVYPLGFPSERSWRWVGYHADRQTDFGPDLASEEAACQHAENSGYNPILANELAALVPPREGEPPPPEAEPANYPCISTFPHATGADFQLAGLSTTEENQAALTGALTTHRGGQTWILPTPIGRPTRKPNRYTEAVETLLAGLINTWMRQAQETNWVGGSPALQIRAVVEREATNYRAEAVFDLIPAGIEPHTTFISALRLLLDCAAAHKSSGRILITIHQTNL